MINGETFYKIAYDLNTRKVNESRYILLVFTDDIALKYYRNYFRGNKNIILKSFDSIKRSGLAGLRYKEYFVLNFITSIEDIKNIIDELEKYIKIEAKVELYGDKTGLRTFADVNDILDKLKALKEGK